MLICLYSTEIFNLVTDEPKSPTILSNIRYQRQNRSQNHRSSHKNNMRWEDCVKRDLAWEGRMRGMNMGSVDTGTGDGSETGTVTM